MATTKVPVEGVIPPGVFYPDENRTSHWGSTGHGPGFLLLNKVNGKKAAALLVMLSMTWLGMSRGRLWLVLGGAYMGGSYKFGRTHRISHCFMERLAFLLWLRGAFGVNTEGIHLIDWKEGVIYFNKGEELRFKAKLHL